MRANLRLVAAAACLVFFVVPFARGMPGRNSNQEKKLAARIEREKNPGKKARLIIRLAKLKLKQADAAYHGRDFAEGQSLLQQYLQQVRRSWATLQGAQNAIHKHLRAFKDLEISLRQSDRFLEDLRRRVPYPESEAIRSIVKQSREVHNQVLEAIFPTGFRPRRKTSRSLHPRRLAPARPGTVKL